MLSPSLFFFLVILLHNSQFAFGLGSTCSAPLGSGSAASGDPYWLESIQHQGTSPFNLDPTSYQVFRNVKDYGAKGDGITDDTAAINAAMSSGGRCGPSCGSSTYVVLLRAYAGPELKVVDKYVVSSPIETYYYTQIIGDARNPPTLLASSDFDGSAIIDADPYIPDAYGAQWFINQDNLFRSVRNLIIDLRQVPSSNPAIGLHWQVAQATSLINIVVEMSTDADTNHQGISRAIFCPGKVGIEVGNQQFTMRNLTVNNAVTGKVNQNTHRLTFLVGFTFQGVTINNCQVGFALKVGGTSITNQGVGSEIIVDVIVKDTAVFVQSSASSNGSLPYSLVLNNIQLTNVPVAVGIADGTTVLEGGTTMITSWGQGNVYSGTSGQDVWTQGSIVSASKPFSLLDDTGKIFGKGHPQYANYATSEVVSVKSQGAKGDGKTDDASALQEIFDKYAGCKIIFFDAGVYNVSDTITIPAGTQIVGEAWSVISAGGYRFQSQSNPRPAIRAGIPGSMGIMEISDLLLTTSGPAPGAIMIEWNVHDPVGQQGAAGLWDTHIRLGGAVGTNMQQTQCPAGSMFDSCQAAFLGIHLTSLSSAYFEGTWVWTADHDLDGSGQTSVFTGRGILSESAGPVWLIGTSEHATLYQYNLVNAQNHYIGFAQTETPYYQPLPAPPAPFCINNSYHDPTFHCNTNAAWGMYIQSSSNILVFGAGFYSFYRVCRTFLILRSRPELTSFSASQNFRQTCVIPLSCQQQILDIDSASAPTVTVYGLSTVGTTFQLSVDHEGIVNAGRNSDGFQQTMTVWHY
ncbi:glycoside hydrolase family 55 protein [Chiua virens]|nr:glycoside hydrolase family 55 protein [Chiua virens]